MKYLLHIMFIGLFQSVSIFMVVASSQPKFVIPFIIDNNFIVLKYQIGHETKNFIYDSASNVNYIDSSYAETLGVFTLKDIKYNTPTLNGHVFHSTYAEGNLDGNFFLFHGI